jgi:3-dehydroquinate synthase
VNITKTFRFGAFPSSVRISRDLPSLDLIAEDMRQESPFFHPLIICDENTLGIAQKIAGKNQGKAAGAGSAADTADTAGTGSAPGSSGLPGGPVRYCVLKPGEYSKTWESAETILRAAFDSGIGRDGVFIGVGGGIIGDLSAFAASIYMRGCRLCLVSTTLLGMTDASLGGKTGFDLFGIKNLAGTFYPARHIYMPLESLETLPPAEWKSGMAELIKTAILQGGDFPDMLESLVTNYPPGSFSSQFPLEFIQDLLKGEAEKIIRCISRAVELKGRIVEEDPQETQKAGPAPGSGGRLLLNLGHTFGHALESSAGLGKISHGEAVAWGLARSCELGLALGITPRERAEKTMALLRSYGYEIAAPHPLLGDEKAFLQALKEDKKKNAGKTTFIVPDSRSARPVTEDTVFLEKTGANPDWESLLKQIITGALTL